MLGACANVRVLDLTDGVAGSLATMVLADFGAEVVRLTASADGQGWEQPVDLLVHRGKKSVICDIATTAGQAEIHRIIGGVDVVVEDMGPSRAQQAGVDYETLSALHPTLVQCSIGGFGQGRYQDVIADDGLVMAKAGIFRDQPGWDQDRRRPIYRASKDASYFAATLVVQGVLSALRARDLTGVGQHVDTTLLQALCCRQNPKIGWLLRQGELLPPEDLGDAPPVDDMHVLAHHRDPREVGLTGMLVQCKDDRWIVHALTEPHFFPAWIDAIGFSWIRDDERFSGAPHQFPDAETKGELIDMIRARIRERTADEWMQAYLESGNVCGEIVQTTQEALRHAQVVSAGYSIEIDDPRVGRIVEIGPIAQIPGAPAEVRGSAPLPGADTDEVLSASTTTSPLPAPLPAPQRDSLPKGPLDGITIVEAAYYYATPFATALLADLGARVIKIERPQGDPYRKLTAGRADPVRSLGHNNMVRAMQGKESIALDLKDPRGREIVHQLIAKADVFVHSFRPGVPESLGIDEATLRGVNPDIVYQYGGSYGSVGPYSRQPAIDPVIAAFSGQTAYQTGEANPPLTETGADPIAAAGHAAAMVLGLFARHRTGKGQYVESAMVISNIYANIEDALTYDGKPDRPTVDALQYGTAAAHRLYETAHDPDFVAERPTDNPKPHWVFLSADADEAFARFCDVADRTDIAADPRFATASARKQNRAELEPMMEEIFAARTARDWETSLLNVGVGCVVADEMSHFAYLYDERQRDVPMMVETEHVAFGGTYSRHAPLIDFSATPGQARPFCENGEHTRALLIELGYTDDQITELEQANVIALAPERLAATATPTVPR